MCIFFDTLCYKGDHILFHGSKATAAMDRKDLLPCPKSKQRTRFQRKDGIYMTCMDTIASSALAILSVAYMKTNRIAKDGFLGTDGCNYL